MEKFVHIFNTVPRITFDSQKELVNKNKIIEIVKKYCMKHKFQYSYQETDSSYIFEFKSHENRDSVAEYMKLFNATLIG